MYATSSYIFLSLACQLYSLKNIFRIQLYSVSDYNCSCQWFAVAFNTWVSNKHKYGNRHYIHYHHHHRDQCSHCTTLGSSGDGCDKTWSMSTHMPIIDRLPATVPNDMPKQWIQYAIAIICQNIGYNMWFYYFF